MEEYCNGLFINKAKEKKVTERYVKELATKTPSTDQLVVNLSGGNQQKVVIAKWLAMEPNILIMDEPLQGLDAETKEKVATVIKTQTAGKTVLFVTHDEKEAEFFEAECMELV